MPLAINHTTVEASLRQLSELITEGRDLVGCDGICLHLLDARRRAILLQVVSSGYIAGRSTQFMPLEDCSAVRTSIEELRTLVVDDALADQRVAQRAIERFKIRACVYAPLAVEGRGEGILIPSFRTAHAWSPAELEQISALAERCASQLVRRGEDMARSSG